MINRHLDSPSTRAMQRHAAQVYLAAIYTTAGLPVPGEYLSDIVATRAKRAAAKPLYRIVRPGAESGPRPTAPRVERSRAQVLEMRARAARVEMGILRSRVLQ